VAYLDDSGISLIVGIIQFEGNHMFIRICIINGTKQ